MFQAINPRPHTTSYADTRFSIILSVNLQLAYHGLYYINITTETYFLGWMVVGTENGIMHVSKAQLHSRALSIHQMVFYFKSSGLYTPQIHDHRCYLVMLINSCICWSTVPSRLLLSFLEYCRKYERVQWNNMTSSAATSDLSPLVSILAIWCDNVVMGVAWITV